MTITELVKKAGDYAIKNGWWKSSHEPGNLGELLMLTVSELGEACEAARINSWAGEFTNDPDMIEKDVYEKYIRGTVDEELADAVIRIADIAARFNVDLDYHIRAKQRYNTFREYRHGGKSF
jgi:NTP pyrophosphatase (non-canonical NTP hydrolase)